ncbi:hypothetical protein CRUP_025348 [Coryphaenoides rupestris]
MLAVM